MSSSTGNSSRWAEEEAQWQMQRLELYEQLYRDGQNGLNRDAVQNTRQHFTPGKEFTPKPYVFPNENDCVALICAEIPAGMAEICHNIGQELIGLLPRTEETNDATGYVNERDLMHVTLFHTSHPDDLAPNAKDRREQDIAQLTAMAKRFTPFQLTPVRVLLASSGAIIMLFQCVSASSLSSSSSSETADVVNVNQEFSVDHLRRVAKETFEFVPKKGTRTIIHSTLARILDPSVTSEVLMSVRERCDVITERLLANPEPFTIDKLWYVEETHNFSPQGHKTIIQLGNNK